MVTSSRTMGFVALMVVMAIIHFPTTRAACPNKCSGHGTCGPYDNCICAQHWTGGDCSTRSCPYTRAWADTPYGDEQAHYYAECGNKGVCDRATARCVCDPGYTGQGCRRMSCPNDCSGHGTCEYIEDMAGEVRDYRYKPSLTSYTYTSLWEVEKVVMCRCDPGWQGHNCAQRMCPFGNDPLTVYASEGSMIQYVKLKTSEISSFFLTYYDLYGNQWTTDSIVRHATLATTCANIQIALRNLPNRVLDTVTVEAVNNDAGGKALTRTAGVDVYSVGTVTTATVYDGDFQTCLITFPETPGTTGLQRLFDCNAAIRTAAGYQPISGSGNTGSTCTVGEAAPATTTSRPLTEAFVCSNRGACDTATGLCKCYSGHRGLACERQEAVV